MPKRQVAKEILTDKRTKNGQTNRWKYTNFESNLAMRIYLPVKFELDCIFEQESGTKNVDPQTNGWTELHQFLKQPSYDGDLCPCQV